jgi:hypothetical protein
MVDEREAEHELRAPALDERCPLGVAPADRRRRVGEVDDQRQDLPLVVGFQSPVERVDDMPIRVDRNDVLGARAGDTRKAPVVTAEVPDEPALLASDYAADEVLLLRRLVLAVRAGRAVISPRTRSTLWPQPPDEVGHLGDVRLYEPQIEARLLQVAPDLTPAVLVPAVEGRMEKDVS